VSAWLKKTKSDTAKLKWLSGSNKRYFTIDFDAQVFFYSHSKDQKGVSEKVAFQDIISIEEVLPQGKTGKKGSSDSKSFRVVTRCRVFDLQASSIAEAEQWVRALGVAKDRGQVIQAEGEERATEQPAEPNSQPTGRPLRGGSADTPTSSLWSAQNMDRRGSAGGTSSNTDPSTGGSTTTPQPEQENAGRLSVPELNLTDDGNYLQDAGKATPNSARQPSCFGTPAGSPSKRGEEAPLSQWGKLDELEEGAESGVNQAEGHGNIAPEKVAKVESEQVPSRSVAPIGAPLEAKKPAPGGAACTGSGPDLSTMAPPPPAPKDPLQAAPPPSAPQTMGEQVAMPPMPPLEAPAAMSNVGSGPDLAAVPPPPPAAANPATGDLPPLKPNKLPPVVSGGSGPNLAGLPPPPATAAPLTQIGAGIPLKKPLPQTSGAQQSASKPQVAAAQVVAKPQTAVERKNAIWQWADQDCDGILNRTEVERFVLKMEGQPMHYQQYVQMCKMFNADANTGLTFEHIQSMYDKGMSNVDEDFEKISSDRQAGAPTTSAASAIEEPKLQAPSTDAGPEVVEGEDRVPCPHCGRRFAPEAAARHVPICQRAKAKPSREKRRTITAVRTASSGDASSATPATSSTAGVADKGEEPSGWDSDENIQATKTKAAPQPAVQRVPEGPATGQEASGWDSDDDVKDAAKPAAKDGSDEEGKDQAMNARPKKLAPLPALEFDMTNGPRKACPKNLAERLSKKSSKKSKRDKDSKNGAEAQAPSGWDSDEDKGSKKKAVQPVLANDALDRPVSAGFVSARNKSTPKGGSHMSASSPEGEALNQLLGEITTDDLNEDVADDHQLVPDFLCTQCDRQVLRINNHIWNQGVTYMFLRNNYPNALSLRAQLILKKGCCAYCCQCSSRSADIQAELEDVANGLRWRVVQSTSAVS